MPNNTQIEIRWVWSIVTVMKFRISQDVEFYNAG
jgi:hypothetical protein